MSDKNLIERAARRLEELRHSRPADPRGEPAPPRTTVAARKALTASRPADVYRGESKRAAGIQSQSVELDLKGLSAGDFVTRCARSALRTSFASSSDR